MGRGDPHRYSHLKICHAQGRDLNGSIVDSRLHNIVDNIEERVMKLRAHKARIVIIVDPDCYIRMYSKSEAFG